MRAGSGHDLLLEDVPVTEEALLPGEPDAYLQVLRYLVGPAVGLGIARSARDWLLFRLRRQGLAPTVALGRIEAELLGAEEQLDGLAARLDRADPSTPRRAALLRLPLLDAAERALRAVVGLSGPAALTTRHPLERQLRDLLALRAQLPPRSSCSPKREPACWLRGRTVPERTPGRSAATDGQRVPTAARTARRARPASSCRRRIRMRCSSPAPGTS
ncbi:hypothetical protein ACFQZC_31210 [Streptacidiphilus monticola]